MQRKKARHRHWHWHRGTGSRASKSSYMSLSRTAANQFTCDAAKRNFHFMYAYTCAVKVQCTDMAFGLRIITIIIIITFFYYYPLAHRHRVYVSTGHPSRCHCGMGDHAVLSLSYDDGVQDAGGRAGGGERIFTTQLIGRGVSGNFRSTRKGCDSRNAYNENNNNNNSNRVGAVYKQQQRARYRYPSAFKL